MPAEPLIKPLSQRRRALVYWFFILVFLCTLPIIVFYAMGYRFEFTKRTPNIVSTGGLYISVPVADTDIYINEELVRDIRVFRRASYIQNLEAGVHRVHVQGEGVYTWVKELPVRPHIVTEAQSFNLPMIPQIRLIGPYISGAGEMVYPGVASSTIRSDFSFASTSNAVVASTTLKKSALIANGEYDFVETLFSSSTPDETLVDKVVHGVNDAFTFPSLATSTSETIDVATTTVVAQHMKLYKADGDVYAQWQGPQNTIPYYFCVFHQMASTTVMNYGEHVYEGVANVLASMPVTESQDRTGRICRDTIGIDHLGQTVRRFTFVPGSTDLVLQLLEDGLYVTEIDDRAWQNTQLLYPGEDIDMVIDGGRIFIKDRDYYLEVYTELQ